MRKDPAEVFDIDEIASRNLEEANLRAKALDLALRLCQWHEEPPGRDMTVLANKIHKWFHSGEWV